MFTRSSVADAAVVVRVGAVMRLTGTVVHVHCWTNLAVSLDDKRSRGASRDYRGVRVGLLSLAGRRFWDRPVSGVGVQGTLRAADGMRSWKDRSCLVPR